VIFRQLFEPTSSTYTLICSAVRVARGRRVLIEPVFEHGAPRHGAAAVSSTIKLGGRHRHAMCKPTM
jgi:hypothetical protein